MTELNTQIELIVSEIIGATRKAKTIYDLGQANTNGINDIIKLVNYNRCCTKLPTDGEIEKLLVEEFKKNNVNFDNNFRYDYVDDSFTDVLKSVIGVVKKLNYIPYCKSDIEQLKAEIIPTFDKYLLKFERKDMYGETMWLTGTGYKTKESMMQMYEDYITSL